ncbi:N2,N2-dimethylguanosine tRNA methyltransferase [Methanocella sp. CWC-04]|uniref:tRNA (guanine(10)-N(2))-dimethyltransferase n=2 Tax=Methanooceanicella nereidis TaxID=2052831 RepID=A0AAP2RG20_9EURY|nr:N2,N2-dimethylguanosine tRNA methyltransferase [Methanocella sp. CWC-04]
MRRLVFELSGEHETLPKSEIIACIEAYGWHYDIIKSYDQVIIMDTDSDVNALADRLALTHNILEIILDCKNDAEDILKEAQTADIKLKEGETFVVRVNRIKNYGSITADFERKLGAVFWHRGYPVNLTQPDAVLRALITEDRCIFGRLIRAIDRAQYDERAPLKKPFFLPGVLMPRISRAVVNMSRITEGWMLDPFSGTGGTLVEAGLISHDIKVVGCDIQKKMVYGTRKNLRHYGTNYHVIKEDSLNMGIKTGSVDAIVTDFPYGVSTPIAAESLEVFYRNALREMYRALKEGRYTVVICKEPMEKLLKEAGFIVIETHAQRIHKSLTRYISLAKK